MHQTYLVIREQHIFQLVFNYPLTLSLNWIWINNNWCFFWHDIKWSLDIFRKSKTVLAVNVDPHGVQIDFKDDASHECLPSDIKECIYENLKSHLTVKFWLWLNSQHSQWGRHVQISGYSNMAKVNVEGNTPNGEKIWKNEKACLSHHSNSSSTTRNPEK